MQDASDSETKRMKVINKPLKKLAIGVLEINCVDTKFLNVNEAMCQLTGYSKEELMKLQFKSLLRTTERKKFHESIKSLHPESANSYSIFHIKKKDWR